MTSGFQVLGERFALPDGSPHDGLGLLDVRTVRSRTFIEGPVVTRPNHDLGLPPLSGYESHFGLTELGPASTPLATLEVGRGNTGAEPALDGAVSGRVLGTYLHGPVLARNPELADLLLAWSWAGNWSRCPILRGGVARRQDRRGAAWAAAGRKRVKM